MKILNQLSIFFWFGLIGPSAIAEVMFQASVSVARVDLDNTQVNGPDFEDEFDAGAISIGAYRQLSEKSYVGSAIEYVRPFSRDADVGSGRIVGFRAAGVKYAWSDRLLNEFYFGTAMYEWERKADGLYYGTNVNYRIVGDHLHLLADLRFYNDLNYDNQFGDLVASGFQLSLGLSVTF